MGTTPPDEGRGLRVERDSLGKWWLVGCAEGDCALPTMGEPVESAEEAVEVAFAWLVAESEVSRDE